MLTDRAWPKISIVTPSYNLADFLEATIKSIVLQAYPNLEYIIIDGGSTDGSIDIIKKYEKYISYWVSEKDNGMYHALQKGFERSTGEIMGWLNADDLLHPYSLFTLAELFTTHKDVQWIQGVNCVIDKLGRVVRAVEPYNTTKYAFYLEHFLNKNKDTIKPFGTLQQESTYWKRDLWVKAGQKVDLSLKYAGDFELWMRFFRHELLYIAPTLIGAFRHRKGQLSGVAQEEYIIEALAVVEREKAMLNKKEKDKVSLLQKFDRLNILKRIPRLRNIYFNNFNSKMVFPKVNYYEN